MIAATVLVLGYGDPVLAGEREPLVGPHPWDFPHRNRETAFAYQLSRDQHGGLAGAAGIAAANGLPLIVNSTSMAVGNWQQIEMTLAEGAEGLIMTENHQDNSGDALAISDVLNESYQAFADGDITLPPAAPGSGGDHQSGGEENHSSGDGDRRHGGRRDQQSGDDDRRHGGGSAQQSGDNQSGGGSWRHISGGEHQTIANHDWDFDWSENRDR